MNNADYQANAVLFQHGYRYDNMGGIGFFRAESLNAQPRLSHGFTSREGGVSKPPYNSLNLGFEKDEADAVRENFQRFCTAANLNENELVIVNYEHGTNVVRVDAANTGNGFDKADIPFCDGLITNDPSIALLTSHADCGAYFFYDKANHAIGLAHAGWKGTLGRIGARVIEKMQLEFGSNPGDILAATGPCICGNCFEVDEELGRRFIAEFGCSDCCAAVKPGKLQLDLEIPAAIQFLEAGIKAENITLMHACTYDLYSLLFSHRRDNGQTGSMAAYMKLL